LIRARIDGRALESNLNRLRQLAPQSRVMAVVKANAYGHGLVAVARALHGADALAVARLEEGVLLREAGIQGRIVLLEGVFDAEQQAEAARLKFDLVVHDPVHIALLEQYRGEHRFDLWLKIDTGMNRLGFRPESFQLVWQQLQAVRCAQLRLMTHLLGSDEPDGLANTAQMARFKPVVDWVRTQSLRAASGPALEVSIANSAATLAAPAMHADWVRPGLALYGVSPFADSTGAAHSLRPVMTLESMVIAIRIVSAGETVGYSGRWRAPRPTRVAILAAGYGDGLLRSLPDGAPVLINGRRAGLAGRVSMDMIAVDVTDHGQVEVGDRAELWGAELPVEEVAAAAGTIPYELLCGVSQRVPLTFENQLSKKPSLTPAS
jgi:alanine racemase